MGPNPRRTIGLLLSISALAAAPPAAPRPAATPAGVRAAVVSGEVGTGLDSHLKTSGYTGGVLVARHGRVLLLQGYGMADRAKGIPFGPDTVFPIGSVTKQFTAAAILKLEMQGKLRVDDRIGRFVPDVPADKNDITLHHLLTHTSGLESDFAGDFEPIGRDPYVGRILQSTLRSRPGEIHFYSNSGYSLLGAIVEIASGQGYEAFLQEHLFRPAGMTETGYNVPQWSAERVAKGYRGEELWGTLLERPWAPDGPGWALRANGGIHSTLSDLYRWHVALEGEAILSKDAKEKAFNPHVPEGPRGLSHYGYGWAIFKTPRGGRLVAHNGGNGIYSADFRRYVDDGLVVITASNVSTVKAFDVSPRLARIAFGEAAEGAVEARRRATPLGDTAHEARVRAYAQAFNSADLAVMRAFRASHMSATHAGRMTDEERDRVFEQMVANLGRIEIEGVLERAPEAVVVLARAASGEAIEMRFEFEPGPDGKIVGLAIEQAEP